MAQPGQQGQQTLQTISTLYDLMLRKQASEQALAQQRSQQAQTFLNIARNMRDPSQLHKFIDVYSSTTGIDRGALQELASGTTPATEVTVGGQVAAGANQMSPYEAHAAALSATSGQPSLMQTKFLDQLYGQAQATPELAGALAVRTATGGGLTDYVRGLAMSRLTPGELEQGAGVGQGTRLSAEATQQGQQFMQNMQQRQTEFGGQQALGWAGLRQQERQLIATSAIQEAGLQIDREKLAATGTQLGGQMTQKQVEELGTSIRFLQQNKAAMGPAELSLHLNNINAQVEGLKRAGIIPKEQKLLTADDILKPWPIMGYPGPGK